MKVMMQNNKFRAALVQLRSGQTVSENIAIVKKYITQAAQHGADYILTPENTSLMELRTAPLFSAIEPEENNSSLITFQDLAKELRVWLHIGSLAVKLSETTAANRSFVISPKGQIAARYDKIHMFDVELPNGENYRESKNYAPGDKAVLAQLPWATFGLTICYDLRFPHLYRTLAQAGAHIITVPSAFTEQTGRAHWHVLLRARAIETGCYIFAAAQGGQHENGRSTYGHSLIVTPWGETLAQMGQKPGWVCADIDLQAVEKARAQIPSLQHDRAFSPNADGAVQI